MADENKGNEAAEKTAAEQSARIDGLQKALTDQNEAGKRLAEGKTTLETELATSQAKIQELEAKADPKEVKEQIADLRVELARSKAVSAYGIPENVASQLQGTPDQISALAKVMSETYKAETGDDTKTADEKKAEEDLKKADEVKKKTDDQLSTYSHTTTNDIDSLMKDVTESMAIEVDRGNG